MKCSNASDRRLVSATACCGWTYSLYNFVVDSKDTCLQLPISFRARVMQLVDELPEEDGENTEEDLQEKFAWIL